MDGKKQSPQLKIHRSFSPSTEKYRLKHAHLQEKYQFVQAETSMLRQRVQAVRREVIKLGRIKRVLCNMLEQRGDQLYKAYLEMNDEDPVDTCLDLIPKNGSRVEEVSRKRAKPIAKARIKDTMTPEQKEEEERAKQRIVSIIDSVFTESAKKRANLNAAAAKYIDSESNEEVPATKQKPELVNAATSPIQELNREEQLAIAYRMETVSSPKTKDHDAIHGSLDGISYSFIAHPNPVIEMKVAEEKSIETADVPPKDETS